jgi:CRISPR-associated protein Cmr4
MISSTLYLYTETPLHAGAGSGLSSIDLPIQRERATQYPMIQGSGIKGKLRASFTDRLDELSEEGKKQREELINAIFGPPATNGMGSDYAGALTAGDARLLLFPVRSLNGVFAYTTSADILGRFKRDIERTAVQTPLDWEIPEPQKDTALVNMKSDVQSNNTIVLEEFSYVTEGDSQVDKIAKWLARNAFPNLGSYWTNKLQTSLVILPNDVFRDFALYATEVITRVRINREKKTVERGALWTEEHLPTDTLLYVPLYANKARKAGSQITEQQVLNQVAELNNTHTQLGGDETVGRGIVRLRLDATNQA